MPTDTAAEAFHGIAADVDYPMVIVTTTDGSEAAGCLVGFTAQCSIDPPLLMVWMSKRNHTTRVARGASGLLVHFPSHDDRELAVLFGSQTGDEVDKFARCRWEGSRCPAPPHRLHPLGGRPHRRAPRRRRPCRPPPQPLRRSRRALGRPARVPVGEGPRAGALPLTGDGPTAWCS